MRVALGQATYKRLDLPPIRLVNMLFEANPANQEDQVALIGRPALSRANDVGTGPIWGVFRDDGAIGGDALVLSGTTLYRVAPLLGTVTTIGTAATSHDVTMAAGEDGSVMIAANNLYITDGGGLSGIGLPDSSLPSFVAFMNGRYIAGKLGTGRFYWTGVGDTAFGALNYATTEVGGDNLIMGVVLGDVLWLFGTSTIELWAPTGNLDLPFQRITGRSYDMGAVAAPTVIRVGGAVIFVGKDRSAGGAGVWMASPGMRKISDNAIDQVLFEADPATMRAWTCTLEGHSLYFLCLANKTFVYDLSTSQWTEFGSYGHPAFKGTLGFTQANGLVVTTDGTLGRLLYFSRYYDADESSPIVMEWSGEVEIPTPTPCYNIALECSVGEATLSPGSDDPQVSLCWSDDDGKTWSDWVSTSLGRQGDYDVRPAWKRLGTVRRRRLFRWRQANGSGRITSGDRSFTVRKAKMNEPLR